MAIGLTEEGNAFFSGEIKVGETNGVPNFHVDKEGNVKLNGNITWGASASPTQVLYNASQTASKPTGLYKDFVDGTGGWYKTIGSREYASYTYDGGNTWGDVIKIVGTDGTNGTDATVTRDNIAAALNLLENAKDDGIYRTSAGAIGINASAIKSGSLEIISSESTSPVFSANIVDKKVTLGGFTVKYGSFYSAEPGTSAGGYDRSVIKVVSNDSSGAGGNGGLFFYPSNTSGYASRAYLGFSGSGITVSYKSYTGNPEDSVRTFTLADLYFALHLGSGMSNFKSKGKTGWVGYLIDQSWGNKTKEFLLFINGVCVSMTQEDVAKAIKDNDTTLTLGYDWMTPGHS
jgi:hypothetical protein